MTAKCSRAQRRQVRQLLLQYIRELRGILRRVAPGRYREFPNHARPCHTCAFNPKTDGWRGMELTAYTLMKCFRDDVPFHCHEGIPWRKPIAQWTPEEITHFREHAKLCAGYATVMNVPETKDAFLVAALKVNGVEKPSQEALALAMSAIAGAGDFLQ